MLARQNTTADVRKRDIEARVVIPSIPAGDVRGCSVGCTIAMSDVSPFVWVVAKKRYQAVGFPCNRMLKLSSSRGIRIDVPVLPVSWSFEDHSVIIQALRKGLIEHEASDTGGVPRWQSSCPDRLAEATNI